MHGLKSESQRIDQRQVPSLTPAAELAAHQAHVGDLLSRYLYVYGDQPAERAQVAREIKTVDTRDRATLAGELQGTGAAGALASYKGIDGQADAMRDRITAADETSAKGLYLKDMVGLRPPGRRHERADHRRQGRGRRHRGRGERDAGAGTGS
jgi:hypothetical protein